MMYYSPNNVSKKAIRQRTGASLQEFGIGGLDETTIPAVSIVIEGVVATGFCAAIMTGTNTAASSAGSASWPRRAALRQARDAEG